MLLFVSGKSLVQNGANSAIDAASSSHIKSVEAIARGLSRRDNSAPGRSSSKIW
jgi:hypothetical protein